jgi:hypothetical protein
MVGRSSCMNFPTACVALLYNSDQTQSIQALRVKVGED